MQPSVQLYRTLFAGVARLPGVAEQTALLQRVDSCFEQLLGLRHPRDSDDAEEGSAEHSGRQVRNAARDEAADLSSPEFDLTCAAYFHLLRRTERWSAAEDAWAAYRDVTPEPSVPLLDAAVYCLFSLRQAEHFSARSGALTPIARDVFACLKQAYTRRQTRHFGSRPLGRHPENFGDALSWAMVLDHLIRYHHVRTSMLVSLRSRGCLAKCLVSGLTRSPSCMAGSAPHQRRTTRGAIGDCCIVVRLARSSVLPGRVCARGGGWQLACRRHEA